MNPIEAKLHEIAQTLFRDMDEGKLAENDLGLLSGSTGIVVFCKHYLRNYPDQSKEAILNTYMDSFFDRLTSGVESLTYCNGLSGVLEGLRYLNDNKLIEVDYSDIEDGYRSYLQQFSIYSIRNKNYDYLHGGLGVVKYFSAEPSFVNQVLNALDETAIKDGEKYKWISRLGMEKKYGYNISLSHGISSIVSVLSSLSHPGIDLEKRNRLLTGACNYILSQEIDPQRYGCYFPPMSLENEPQEEIRCSRMGWCYGDLGVATSLWQAGKLLSNRNWQEKAIEVLTFSASRRNLRDCGIFDSGLCHGSASIGMMFYYMYLQTGNKLFDDTYDYWLHCTLEMGRKDVGLAGYGAWRGEQQEYADDYGVLEGISGIGLMLLSQHSKTPNETKWLDFFMLK